MPLLNFSLRPIDEVQPWGTAPDLSLSWFGLTDGCYWIDAGGEELFRFSNEALAKWPRDPFVGPYNDYQVIRLLEDVLAILPDILQPIPPRLRPYIRSVYSESSWRAHCRAFWGSDASDSDELVDRACLAEGWVNRRWVDTLYMTCGPTIGIWREDDDITIAWDNTRDKIEGAKAWACDRGTYSLPAVEFLAEVKSFHERLMAEMERRIDSVASSWDRPEIRIDTRGLVQEHEYRRGLLESALRRKPDDLDDIAIEEAIRWITETHWPTD
jgi:hypothetical protein